MLQAFILVFFATVYRVQGTCLPVGQTDICWDKSVEINTCFMAGANCSNVDLGITCSNNLLRTFSVSNNEELREAIQCSNESPDESVLISLLDDIVLYASWTPGGNSCLEVSGNLMIQGNGFQIAREDVGECWHCSLRVFHVQHVGSLILNETVISGGRFELGANIYNEGKLSTLGGSIQDGRSSEGGGIYNEGIATLNGTTVWRNFGMSNIFNAKTMTITGNAMITIDDENSEAKNFVNTEHGTVTCMGIVVDVPIVNRGSWTNVFGTTNKIYGTHQCQSNEFWAGVSEESILCSECPVGNYLDPNDKTTSGCIPCQPGAYLDKALNECRSCVPGTYNPVHEAEECLPCPGASRSEAGATFCIDYSCFCYGDGEFLPEKEPHTQYSCFSVMQDRYRDSGIDFNQSCPDLQLAVGHDSSQDYFLNSQCCDLTQAFEDVCKASNSIYGSVFMPESTYEHYSCKRTLHEQINQDNSVEEVLRLDLKHGNEVDSHFIQQFQKKCCGPEPSVVLDCMCPAGASFLPNNTLGGVTCLDSVFTYDQHGNMTCEERFEWRGSDIEFRESCCSARVQTNLECGCQLLGDSAAKPGFMTEERTLGGQLTTCNVFFDVMFLRVSKTLADESCEVRLAELPRASFCGTGSSISNAWRDPSSDSCKLANTRDECGERHYNTSGRCGLVDATCSWEDGCTIPSWFLESFSQHGGNPEDFLGEDACSSVASEEECLLTSFTTSGKLCYLAGTSCHLVESVDQCASYVTSARCVWHELLNSESSEADMCCTRPITSAPSPAPTSIPQEVLQKRKEWCESAGFRDYTLDGSQLVNYQGADKTYLTCNDVVEETSFRDSLGWSVESTRVVMATCCVDEIYAKPPNSNAMCLSLEKGSYVEDGREPVMNGTVYLGFICDDAVDYVNSGGSLDGADALPLKPAITSSCCLDSSGGNVTQGPTLGGFNTTQGPTVTDLSFTSTTSINIGLFLMVLRLAFFIQLA